MFYITDHPNPSMALVRAETLRGAIIDALQSNLLSQSDLAEIANAVDSESYRRHREQRLAEPRATNMLSVPLPKHIVSTLTALSDLQIIEGALRACAESPNHFAPQPCGDDPAPVIVEPK